MQASTLQSVLDDLSGKVIVQKSICGNQIRLWFDKPAVEPSIVLTVEPAWRIEKAGKVAAASADFPWAKENDESEDAYRERCRAAWSLSDVVDGKRLIRATCNHTHDVQLVFEDDLVLSSFTVWRDGVNWSLTLYEAGRRILVSWDSIEEQPAD